MRCEASSPAQAQLLNDLQVLQDLQQPDVLPPDKLSPDPAASARAMSSALRRLTEPPNRALARDLYDLAREEQRHLAQASVLLGPVLREALATRLRMHERLEARMEHWLSGEAFRGEIPRQMQGALIQHLQSTRAMGRLLQEVDAFQLADLMCRWQVSHDDTQRTLRHAPPGDETTYYRQRLAALLGAFNRADTLQDARETLDTLWACLTALRRHQSSSRPAADPGGAGRQASTGPASAPHARDIDFGRDLALASIAESNPTPPERRPRHLPALLEHPAPPSTAALLQPPTDLERPWRRFGTSSPTFESTRL